MAFRIIKRGDSAQSPWLLYLRSPTFSGEVLYALRVQGEGYGDPNPLNRLSHSQDGNGCLYGTLSGNAREVIHKFSVDLPKKVQQKQL